MRSIAHGPSQDDPKAATCLLLRQDRCLLLRQDRCLLLRQDRCLLLQEQTSVLSQHTIFKSQKSQLRQCHNVQGSEVSTVAMSQCSSLRSLNCGNVTMFKSQTSQLWQYHNVQVSEVSTVQVAGGLALNRRKWPEMGREWSPDPENRSPGFSRPFPRLWDRSRGPKPPKYSPNSRSTAPRRPLLGGSLKERKS